LWKRLSAFCSHCSSSGRLPDSRSASFRNYRHSSKGALPPRRDTALLLRNLLKYAALQKHDSAAALLFEIGPITDPARLAAGCHGDWAIIPADFPQCEVAQSWDEITAAVSKLWGEDWETLQAGHGSGALSAALYLGSNYSDKTLRELGELAGGMQYPAVTLAVRRFTERQETAPTLGCLFERGRV
jgi:hypothetical protein